ncbi:MAG: polyprenyl synthetase family protein [Myxococcaceae bacterium]|nr:polyprenyl synthetase family protein [Myxococcaceae bacterium]
MTSIATSTTGPLGAEAALAAFHQDFERVLADLLVLPDEAGVDPRWSRAMVELRAYALRPAKRVRPTLLVAGWALATRGLSRGVPREVLEFAAGLELLHTFMLVHDDVADRAATRRGGPTLHRVLASGQGGDDLAIVVGDHVYARAVEVMLGSGLPACAKATQYMMAICRHTAAGQYLDLDLSRTPLAEVTVFQTLKVANLKTARYGFVAPLVAGAMLGGADGALLEQLERVGRQVGLAFQLRDDLIGLFGDDTVAGKAGGGDFVEGKRTFPVIAAWTRADAAGREALEQLWDAQPRDDAALARARALVNAWGGAEATERAIERMTRSARRVLAQLPAGGGVRQVLDGLVARMERRTT